MQLIPAFTTWTSYLLIRSMASNRAGNAFSRPTPKPAVLLSPRATMRTERECAVAANNNVLSTIRQASSRLGEIMVVVA